MHLKQERNDSHRNNIHLHKKSNILSTIVALVVEVKYAAGIPPQGMLMKDDTWSSISDIRGDITTVIPFCKTAGRA